MNNFTSMVIAILEKLEILTNDEAEKLAGELHSATLPDNYRACAQLLDGVFKKHDLKDVSSKLNMRQDIMRLESEVASIKLELKQAQQELGHGVLAQEAKLKVLSAKLDKSLTSAK